MDNALFDQYQRFDSACLGADLEAMRDVVDDEFRVVIPDRTPMNLDRFASYMRALLGVAPDFGRDVQIKDVRVSGTMLVVLYTCAFTFDGNRVEYPAADWVTFKDGLIDRIEVLYSLKDNQLQAYGKAIAKA